MAAVAAATWSSQNRPRWLDLAKSHGLRQAAGPRMAVGAGWLPVQAAALPNLSRSRRVSVLPACSSVTAAEPRPRWGALVCIRVALEWHHVAHRGGGGRVMMVGCAEGASCSTHTSAVTILWQ